MTSTQIATLSLGLLALGMLLIAGLLIGREVQRARRGEVLGRAIRHGTEDIAAPAVATTDGDPFGATRNETELPFHWLDSRLGRALVADEDRKLIDQCGFSSLRAQLIFLVIRTTLAALLPLLFFIGWSKNFTVGEDLAIGMAAFVFGFMAPKWVLSRMAASRRERVSQELPLFVDLLRLLQGVGLSLDQSLQIMATDFSHVLRVLSYELAIANRQYAQGRTREHSLLRLATLHDSENLTGLVALLVQVDKHGGAVQEPLRQYSDRLREHRRSELKERIGKITVKMTGVMVVTLLPALVIITAGPGFLAVFRSLGALAK
ncbi:type II secretion system F family protein [Variovorax sp. CY25R-8]|uniref:type II secretion system F family protein n=1 Tax=Variovorax sp. CY25R-8 TaxID=2855501 RepID=UPI0021BA6894|nr:type II secretion system F family protein [Variovorax sp. CY25R-8]MCT8178327.1 type II secretion system F family protein [Variovorax sp. CY25R-8]